MRWLGRTVFWLAPSRTPSASAVRYIFAIVLLFAASPRAGAQRYNMIAAELRQHVVCTDHVYGSEPQRDCQYRIGSLRFTIAGVGTEDAAVSADKSDADRDYYFAFGIAHGCVIVQRGKGSSQPRTAADYRAALYAFVSPRTGLVYDDWKTCGSDTKSQSDKAGM